MTEFERGRLAGLEEAANLVDNREAMPIGSGSHADAIRALTKAGPGVQQAACATCGGTGTVMAPSECDDCVRGVRR